MYHVVSRRPKIISLFLVNVTQMSLPRPLGSRPGDDRTWSRTDGPLMVHGIMHAPLAVASAGTAVASAGADARGDQIGNKIGKMRLGHFVHAFEFLPCQ